MLLQATLSKRDRIIIPVPNIIFTLDVCSFSFMYTPLDIAALSFNH
jgi:hypothetical protein